MVMVNGGDYYGNGCRYICSFLTSRLYGMLTQIEGRKN